MAETSRPIQQSTFESQDALVGCTVSELRCSVRSCTHPTDAPSAGLHQCIIENCAKQAHVGCCKSLILSKHQVPHLVDLTSGQKVCACSKTCHLRTKKAMIDQPSCIPWNHDRKSDPNDSIASEKVLLDWSLAEENHDQH